jgi:hypothetical protein
VQEEEVGRKYSLQQIGAGDYLFLSNDKRTIWRISRYTEDGSALDGDGTPITGRFWGVWRWRYAVNTRDVDTSDWNEFDMHEGMWRTRAEAVASALRSKP